MPKKFDPRKPSTHTSRAGDRPVSRAEIDLLRQKLTKLIEEKPEKTAALLSEWLKQPAKKPTKKIA